jgi:hypothetical protein
LAIMGSRMPRNIYGCGIGNWWCWGVRTWWHLSTFYITITSHAFNLGCWDVPSSQPKVHVIVETWDLIIGPTFIGSEVHETQRIIWNFTRFFSFSLKELGSSKG